MDRRKSLKIIGASAVGITGLVLADWKWQILDQIRHEGFFTFKEAQTISAIADTIIPEGLPPILPNPDSKPIGALSTGADQYLKKVLEHCYEKDQQDLVKSKLNELEKNGFLKAEKKEREAMLIALSTSENEVDKDFFKVMKSETITGFTTVKEVMVEYRKYQIAPGFYNGCADVISNA